MPEDITQDKVQETAIDWASVNPADIPPEIIKKSESFREVLDESISRRQTISRMKAEQTEQPPTPEAPQETDTEVVPAWAQSLVSTVDTLQQRLADSEKTNIEKAKARAIEQFSIPDDMAEFIVGTSEDEIFAKAKKLGGAVKPQGHKGNTPVGSGAEESDKEHDALMAKVKDKLNGADGSSVFSPGAQRKLGGGPVA